MRKNLLSLYRPGLLVIGLSVFTACSKPAEDNSSHSDSSAIKTDSVKTNPVALPNKADFQKPLDGEQVDLYVLKNKNGLYAALTNYGARLVSFFTPDKTGKPVDVVLGYNTLAGFENSNEKYFGVTVGRYANRIANGQFKLDGKKYQLGLNNPPNTLHGGIKGFESRVWKTEQPTDSSVAFSLLSKDGEEGFPGNLNAKVSYTLNGNNELVMEFSATTDKKTVVNLTNHAYFNLNGEGEGTILDHLLTINADKFVPVSSALIPTGKLQPVEGSPFDFRKQTAIGARIEEKNEQLIGGKGYDHTWVLNQKTPNEWVKAATAIGPKTGIKLEVETSEPGMQFYTGNFLNGKDTGKNGHVYNYRNAFALETQHFPDSPNQPNFPSTVIKPGETYKTKTLYRLSVEK